MLVNDVRNSRFVIIIIMTRRQLMSVATTLHDDRDPVPSSTPVWYSGWSGWYPDLTAMRIYATSIFTLYSISAQDHHDFNAYTTYTRKLSHCARQKWQKKWKPKKRNDFPAV